LRKEGVEEVLDEVGRLFSSLGNRSFAWSFSGS
jgi:hypothetical protein